MPKIPAANLRNGLLKTPNQIICFPFCLTFHRGRENLWQYVLDRSCLRRLRILFRIAKGAATFEGLSIHKIFDCGVWHCAIYTAIEEGLRWCPIPGSDSNATSCRPATFCALRVPLIGVSFLHAGGYGILHRPWHLSGTLQGLAHSNFRVAGISCVLFGMAAARGKAWCGKISLFSFCLLEPRFLERAGNVSDTKKPMYYMGKDANLPFFFCWPPVKRG